ncbi:MAG: M55 family metallopeptidase [Planctomycetota bacterium]|jgi:D-amino peptidase
MKIFLMTDMEGCAGILNHDDWVLRDSMYYEKGRRILTEEVNAAVRGFFDGGAEYILVCDGHGAGGIDPELLDERAHLIRGWEKNIFPFGLDNSFDAVAVVGQHAKAGTDYSHITHTGWFNTIDLNLNGVSIGEFGLLVFCASEFNIPAIFAAGEKALCKEAEELTPGIVTVSVKEGNIKDGLDHLSTDEYRAAKLGAIHKSPIAARKLIQEGAKKAAEKLKSDSKSYTIPKLDPPYEVIHKLRKSGDAPASEKRYGDEKSIIKAFNAR